jgi:transposase
MNHLTTSIVQSSVPGVTPTCLDDCKMCSHNARTHRPREATAYLQSEAVTSVPWSATSPDLNPIDHIWDMLGRRIQAREPPVQNICQLVQQVSQDY